MRIRDLWARVFGSRGGGEVSLVDPSWLLRSPFLKEAGVVITPETAVQVSAVYGCCRLIVDSLASAPIRVAEIGPGGEREILHDDATSYVLNHGASIDVLPEAPPAQAVEESLYWAALLDGNGYAEIVRDRSQKFAGLNPIEAIRVTPRRDENGAFYYSVQQPQGGEVRLAPRDMFHLRGPSLLGWVGDSTVYRAAKAIGISQASQVFAGAYFANGTILSGTINYAGKMSPQQKKTFGEDWKTNYGGGPSKQNGVAVLDQGLEYKPLNHNAQQAQLVESRRFQVQEIARFFGVPTTLLADNEAWTNLSELYLGFYRNALLPWAERFDAEATRKLFPQRAPWREVQHDLTSLVIGTEAYKRTIESLRSAVMGGLKTRNEARAILGDNSLGEEGDELVVEGTVKTLEQVLEGEPQQPASLPAKPAAPAEDPEADAEDPEEPEDAPMPGSMDSARMAVALDRFARVMKARRADLEKNAPGKAAQNLADERAKQLGSLLEECRQSARGLALPADFNMRAEMEADAVVAGCPASEAANRLAEVRA